MTKGHARLASTRKRRYAGVAGALAAAQSSRKVLGRIPDAPRLLSPRIAPQMAHVARAVAAAATVGALLLSSAAAAPNGGRKMSSILKAGGGGWSSGAPSRDAAAP